MPEAVAPPVTKVSTLSNGAKVVTRESGQLGSAVGVVVGCGARDESAAQVGATLQMELMAFKLTEGRSSIRLMRCGFVLDVESAGGNLAAVRGREKIMYVSECTPESAGVVLTALADSVVSPKIVPWEMADASAKGASVIIPRHEQSTAAMVDEAVHSAAFGDSYTLGKPLTIACGLSVDGIKEFRAARYTAPAMTVVGVNVPHEEFAGQAEVALEGADSSSPPSRMPAKYLGGEMRVKHDLGITSVSMAFSAPSGADASAPAYEVLGALLNIRASAAVPGASGFSVFYSDAGLVGVTGSCNNGNGGMLTEALVSCFKGLAEGPSESELEAAIASAKIARGVRMEKPLYAMLTLANATTVGADPVSADTVLEGVTAEAVKEAGMAAVKSELSVGAVGNISEIPLKLEISAML
ncbi:unnamed protein product [Ascophyllum nodosum]